MMIKVSLLASRKAWKTYFSDDCFLLTRKSWRKLLYKLDYSNKLNKVNMMLAIKTTGQLKISILCRQPISLMLFISCEQTNPTTYH